ncbi:MAG TPA: DUF4344 domain-containing metallopeptidase [Paracoccaceae bacterium]|nr:DUF4344 domain-containing metallopeptidase [Paracoccaceae bacterium]HMO71847.1 DUF4344 domain-containing metallopeptidase [Paracoccaceae bacterium]
MARILIVAALIAAALPGAAPAQSNVVEAARPGEAAATADGARLPADRTAAGFVASNLVFVFYHEVAHALIHILNLPVLGREEDAADTLSALLIDALWEEDAAVALTYDSALGFLLFAEEAEKSDSNLAYWGQHSLDLQRYYNLVCLFYGANPDLRLDVADELDLPEERRESCPEEFEMAAGSWGAMLEGMPPQDHGPGFRLVVPAERDALTRIIAEEVRTLNAEYGLPVWVDVTVEPCGEANAFYDPRARRIVICTEYAAELARLFAAQDR